MTTRPLQELLEAVSKAVAAHDLHSLREIEAELRDATDKPLMALTARTRAIIARLSEDHQTAIREFERAIAIYKELDDHEGLLRSFNGIGTIRFHRAEYESALEHFSHALDNAEKTGVDANVAAAFNNIGNVYNDTGEYARAIEYYNRSLELYERFDDLYGQAQAHGNIGLALYRSSDFAGALQRISRSKDLFTEHDNKLGIGRALNMIGSIYHRLEKYDDAVRVLESAVAVHDSIDNVRGSAIARSNLGNVLLALGEYDRARLMMIRAIEQQISFSDVRSIIGTSCALAQLYLDTDETANADAAIRSLDEWPISDASLNTRIDLMKAKISLRKNDIASAQDQLQNVLDHGRTYGLHMEMAEAYAQLQEIAKVQNDLTSYIEYNTEYQRIKEQILGKETVLRIASQETERRIAVERHERDKERAVLYSTLPKNIADRIVRGERITGDQFEDAAVIFVDIVGFTRISAQMSASDVVGFLEQLFSRFDAICKRHGVTKIKTIGDSYMAVAFPDASPELEGHADTPSVRAARAGIEMLQDVSRISYPENLQVRIGLHAGPVTAGVIGTERLQYDVWGDTVNVASRFESTGEPGRIHLSQHVADELNSSTVSSSQHLALGTWHLALRGEIDLKGKGVMTTYWLDARHH